MVYCGKPSRGCQMCRTRRIKCDESKPTCQQCQKSRRPCPGYKDDFDLVFRNETQATERRARRGVGGKKSHPQVTFTESQIAFSTAPESFHNDVSQFLLTPKTEESDGRLIGPSPAFTVPIDERAPCYFMSNYVISPRQAARGYFDFLMPMLKSESPDSPIGLAFSAVALASLANRPVGRGTPWVGDSCRQYTKALKAVNIALQNPVQQKADTTLAAIIMLSFFENIMASPRGNSSSAWFSHVEGAVQLVKLRGKKSQRTKIGYSLFVTVRSQMVIQCMASSRPPVLGSEWWMSDRTQDDNGNFAIKLNLHVAELRYEINTALVTYSRTPENFQKVLELIRRAQALETEYLAWEQSLPAEWRPRTVAWVDQIPGGDITKAEVCPGKVDVFTDVWLANNWNHSRVARLFISGSIVRCAAWVCSPVDYRTTPEYAQSVRLCADLVADIVASIPYNLGWRLDSNGALKAPPGSINSPLSHETFGSPKALGGYFCLWPLFAVNNSDYSSDSQRKWAKGRLCWITENLGMNQAKILSGFQLRLPSMIIRRDSMLHAPPSAQQLAAYAARSAYNPSPTQSSPVSNSPSSLQPPNQSPGGMSNVNGMCSRSASILSRAYRLSPLQQRELMQREAWEKEQTNLLKQATNSEGDSVERLVQTYLAV